MQWTADRIRDLRERLGLSRSDFGRILYGPDQSYRSVWRLEKGKHSPSPSAILTMERLDAGRLDPQVELSAMKGYEGNVN